MQASRNMMHGPCYDASHLTLRTNALQLAVSPTGLFARAEEESMALTGRRLSGDIWVYDEVSCRTRTP
jgi:hypothetical protein